MELLLAAVMLAAAAFLLLSGMARQRRNERLVARRLRGQVIRESRIGSLLRLLGDTRIGQRSISLDSETQMLLNRIGWRRASKRSLFAACQVGVPVGLMVVVIVAQLLLFKGVGQPLIAPVFALGIGYLLPKRILAAVAQRRQKQVVVEISTFIPLLRILFESGMAVEQALRVLSLEGKDLLPVLSEEIRVVLVRVDSGLELGEELRKTAALLAVDELSDTCVILNQLIHQGGGALKSLLTLKQLIDDRRLTRLQEYISKLSAKMSVVMMVFLFPALLIVLAGPGFIAISRALGS
ncbi:MULTISPECIES: type II secretion system F family protein [Pseudomonas syringae group genomosp. 2]|uniref:Type II secretion system, protein F domain n=1 Tax=Pseudomonas amygdali pv. ulmi TaxID=251720 RepID=A0A0Q0CIY6_PSEA0|nr:MULTISPECIES: type II secretion system F family protein [Pseudomonas syringae group genomosp. 2]EGH01851.1 type II secretion system, protein F domain [Pseudomonas amygdali pv. aesculi str. 0893_23]EGH05739.1 type II secretion system, protein F domain [Pseudomonas amygdali pv. aesculi str. 0893_23]KPW16630.1 Type II secretion system, protein F domain [Pseudomonas amygdali pv. aesculi]KPZ11854.1 Type II secretion system, protein F domain [Pseudomonas amygdali pv. ulmi]KWS09610.1 type II secre